MDYEITEEPARLVAVVRRVVPMAEIVTFYDNAYSEVAAALATAGHPPAGPALGWMHHDDNQEAIDIAAGFPAAGVEPGPLAPGIEVVEIPGGRALAAEHQGSYDGLSEAWDALDKYRAAANLEARGDTIEEYLTEPAPDGDPALNRTRLVMMLR